MVGRDLFDPHLMDYCIDCDLRDWSLITGRGGGGYGEGGGGATGRGGGLRGGGGATKRGGGYKT